MPGSKKAVVECFEAIHSVLPHAIELIRDEKAKTVATHKDVQKDFSFQVPVTSVAVPRHLASAVLHNTPAIPLQLNAEKPFTTSTRIDSSSSRNSEISDISELLEKSYSTMDEVRRVKFLIGRSHNLNFLR